MTNLALNLRTTNLEMIIITGKNNFSRISDFNFYSSYVDSYEKAGLFKIAL